MLNKIIQNLDELIFLPNENKREDSNLNIFKSIRFALKNSQRVIIKTEDRCFFTLAFLACLSLKKTILLPHSYMDSTLSRVIKEGDIILSDEMDFKEIEDDDLSSLNMNPKDLKIIFFTSGTTGTAKEIEKDYSQLEKEIHLLISTFNFDSCNCIVSSVPFFHIYGLLFTILLPLYLKIPVVKNTCVHWEELSLYVGASSVLVTSPTHLLRLDESVKQNCSLIFSSSGPLPFSGVEKCLKSFSKLPIEIYGSTETGGIAYRQQTTENTPWKTFDGISVDISNDQCLTVDSPYLYKPFKTNDRIELHGQNTFSLLGRIDRVVKIEGKRINLQEMEDFVIKHSFFKDCAVSTLKIGMRETLGMIVVLSDSAKETKKPDGELIALLKEYLKGYFDLVFIPRRVVFMDEIPINQFGKRSVMIMNEYLDKRSE